MMGLGGRVRSSVVIEPPPPRSSAADQEHVETECPRTNRGEVDAVAPSSGTVAKTYDVFISHASEDKDAIVRDLAHGLQQRGLEVWYDEFALRIGDSLRRKIESD
jgi:hypothetical protein